MIEFNVSQDSLDDQIAENSSTWSLSDILSRGIDLWKENWAMLMVSALIYFVASTVLGLIPYVGSFVFSLFIGPVLLGGLLAQMYEQDTIKQVNIENLFSQFKKVGSFATVTIITSLVSILLMAPGAYFLSVEAPELFEFYAEAFMGGQPDPTIFQDIENINLPGPLTLVSILLAFIPLILMTTLLWLAPAFITFFNMNGIDAMKYSFRSLKSRFFGAFGLTLAASIVSIAGIIACCIGIVATFPIVISVQYVLFKHITRFTDHLQEGDQIDKHLVS